jgi:hypothetical protein
VVLSVMVAPAPTTLIDAEITRLPTGCLPEREPAFPKLNRRARLSVGGCDRSAQRDALGA